MSGAAPIRVAIVGAGPSGLYAAGHLLERRDRPIEIDLFERLPTPWGLVRGGIAPDHPDKKLITDRSFAFWLNDPRVQFFGNVEIGSAIGHEELAAWYDAIIYATGADGDVKMGIPGESLCGSWSAREFVGFYNGHPDWSCRAFDFKVGRAVVVGNGNVALDVARILTMDVHELAQTDIADHALEALRHSRIREVVILGRRGPMQAAYSNPELEQLEQLRDVNFAVTGVTPNGMDTGSAVNAAPVVRRKMATLLRLASRPFVPGGKRIVFRFLASPLTLKGNGRVEGLVVGGNVLATDRSGKQVLQSTGATETIEAGLVLRAVGYRGSAFPGLPFDDRLGVIRNDRGRVTDGTQAVAGAYTTGWIKRGCNGIVGTNKKCAHETVQNMLEDLRARPARTAVLDRPQIRAMVLKRAPRALSLAQWMNIDHAERSAGRLAGRPRIKFTSREKLLNAALAR